MWAVDRIVPIDAAGDTGVQSSSIDMRVPHVAACGIRSTDVDG